MYDPLVGQFLSGDPLVADPLNGQNYNRYSYVLDNPVNATDPTGFAEKKEETPPPSLTQIAADLAGGASSVTVSYANGKETYTMDANGNITKVTTFAASSNGNAQTGPSSPATQGQQRGKGGAGAGSDFSSTGGRDPKGVKSALYDTGKAAWNSAIDAGNLLMFAGGVDSLSYLDSYRVKYDTPAFGHTLEFLLPVVGSKALRLTRTLAAGTAAAEEGGVLETCCFPAGTPVLTEYGEKNIESIQVGDLVRSRDPMTGETRLKPVVEVFVRQNEQLNELDFQSDTGQAGQMAVTSDHPFWVQDVGWVQTADLAAGMVLVTFDHKTLQVTGVHTLARSEVTYNLNVADFHTYFAGHQFILVHNACGARTEPTLPQKQLAKEGEVTVEHYYKSGDHAPAHAHVSGGGETVKIGPNGKPIPGEPELTSKQRDVIEANKSAIRRAINKIGAWLDYHGQ